MNFFNFYCTFIILIRVCLRYEIPYPEKYFEIKLRNKTNMIQNKKIEIQFLFQFIKKMIKLQIFNFFKVVKCFFLGPKSFFYIN